MTSNGTIVPGLRWSEAFPWIAGAARATGRADGGAEPWWLDLVSDTPATGLEGRLADLADMALVRMTKWSLGELFPLLPQATPIELLPFTNRARNALNRRGLDTTTDLQGLLLMDLLDLPNIGFGTADSMMRVLARACVERRDATAYAEQPVLFEMAPQLGPEPPAALPREFAEDLRALASWYTTLGFPGLPLLSAEVPAGTPQELREARERLLAFRAADVPSGTGPPLTIAGMLELELRQLSQPDRTRDILARRFFADDSMTLDALAGPLELTRERVRQLESKARAQLALALDDGPLTTVGAAVRELVGTVLPLGDLLRLVPALGEMVDSVGQPAWRVLDRLDDAYEIEDGWCAAPSLTAAQAATQAELGESGGTHGVVALANVTVFYDNPHVEVPEKATREWLAYCGYAVRDHWVFTRTRSMTDWAAGILFTQGAPLPVHEIHERLPEGRSLISLRNALHADDRFKRVDRDEWALAEWGGEEYSGIKSRIREELSRNGGEIDLNTLLENITGRFSVSASSVAAYASNPPFESAGGRVRFATGGGRESRKPLRRTARLYRHAGSLLYRVTVTTDHLRGSGFPAPVALASELGLRQGQACELRSPLGTQALSWANIQPAFGSVSSLLMRHEELGTGQEIFLVIGVDDRSFDIRPVDDGDGETGPLTRALRLTGCVGPEAADPLPALAQAIDLPASSPVVSVIGGYRDRGDTEVAEQLLSVREQLENSEKATVPAQPDAPDIDDILGLL